MGPPLAAGARVLVRLPSWLGDVVAAEPAVHALAVQLARAGADAGDAVREADGAGLTLVAPAPFLAILDGLWPAARRLSWSGDADPAQAWRGHDVALLFTNSFRSAWGAWRAGIPRRVGWARDLRGWLLTDAMRPARERGACVPLRGMRGRGRRYLPRPFAADCRELVGLLGVAVQRTRPRLPVLPAAAAEVRARLAANGVDPEAPFLLVNAGGRAGSAKAAPPERLAEALQLLAGSASGRDLAVVLVAGPEEEEGVLRVVEALAGARARVVALVDPIADLHALSALARLARAAWTADGGALHVLRAHGTPRVVLLGPTDPRHTAEGLVDAKGRREELRLRVPVACGPCQRERCPLGGADERRCMLALEPRAIVEATESLLG